MLTIRKLILSRKKYHDIESFRDHILKRNSKCFSGRLTSAQLYVNITILNFCMYCISMYAECK